MRSRRSWLATAVVAAALTAGVGLVPGTAQAAPALFSKIQYVPCTWQDGPQTTLAATAAEFAQLQQDGRTWTLRDTTTLQGPFLTELQEYWRRASLGNINDVEMTPWVRVGQTGDTFKTAGRHARWQLCRDQAAANGWIKPGYVTVVMLPYPIPTLDFGGDPGWALVGTGLDVSDIAHETGHAIGLNHSWGPPGTTGPNGVNPEYNDPFDVMGLTLTSQGGYPYRDSANSQWGPGLAAPQLDTLGYIPADRHTSLTGPGQLILRALSHYDQPGALIATGLGLTLELRVPDGPDTGIGQATLVLHQDNSASPVTLLDSVKEKESKLVLGHYIGWQRNYDDVTAALVDISDTPLSYPNSPTGGETMGSSGGQPPGACQPGDYSLRCQRQTTGLPELSTDAW